MPLPEVVLASAPDPASINDGRWRRVVIGVNMIRDLVFTKPPTDGCFVRILKHPDLPVDAVLLSVHAMEWDRAFSFLFWHPSFTPCAEGCEIPRLDGPADWSFEYVPAVRTQPD